MGTRGFITFVIDGQEKTAYSQAASAPGDLGLTVLRWLRDSAVNYAGVAEARARALRLADPTSLPSPADFQRLRRYAGPGYGERPSWYRLLWHAQGSPGEMLRAGVIEDASEMPQHPQARWGYVIDFDARALEVYEGGQREAHDRGRFARKGPVRLEGMEFWPAALVTSWPFSRLPADTAFTEACYAQEAARG